MDNAHDVTNLFPQDLVEWAGQHSGGVKRLFDAGSGRPGKTLLRTNLIGKLESWAAHVASGTPGTPRVLLLVGGPGNGKTEAIEHTINCLDHGLAAHGRLVDALSKEFHPEQGKVPRVVNAKAGTLATPPRILDLQIVQDVSVTAGKEGMAAPVLLIEELRSALNGSDSSLYLCCVNRGVLDDALIYSLDNGIDDAQALLEAITRSVSLTSKAPSCWPLAGFPAIAIWPMDAESLLVIPDGAPTSPAAALLEHATTSKYWPATGSCAAGDKCPFCHSHLLLTKDDSRLALEQILRWYELASGKRWSFRDLFSLVSYLLAGHHQESHGQKTDPCGWAAHLIELDKAGHAARQPGRHQLTAIFHLATSSYQHALFHLWDKNAAGSLRQDTRDLSLGKDNEEARVIQGLLAFLQERKSPYLPATIAPLLESLAELLDPALASPDMEVPLSSRSKVMLGELDTRFSRSLPGAVEYVRKYQFLSVNELDLLKRLAKADTYLSLPAVRRKKPTAASRIQRTIRDFACRLVRRSICTRSALVAGSRILEPFQRIVEDQGGKNLHEVAQQVKGLLNSQHGFEVSLTTTFGQPLPPQQRQSILLVQPQPVRPLQIPHEGRPRSPICFLQVGHGQSLQPIALTYDLFKAIKELERGLSPASLPRTVVALLDTTKARLSGAIVRNQEILDDARILVGAEGVEVAKSWNGFVALEGGRQA